MRRQSREVGEQLPPGLLLAILCVSSQPVAQTLQGRGGGGKGLSLSER